MSVHVGSGPLVLNYDDSEEEIEDDNPTTQAIYSAEMVPHGADPNNLQYRENIANLHCNMTEKASENNPGGKVDKEEDQTHKEEIEILLSYKEDPDMYDRVIAPELRGKIFKVSNNGQCPKCNHKKNVFVILDFLFPMGDMPDICNHLIAKGQAVLWSSQDDSHCKDPPTLLCRGRCPTDPAKCGFNLNWNKTNLENIFFFPVDTADDSDMSSQNVEPPQIASEEKSEIAVSATKIYVKDFNIENTKENPENVSENVYSFDEREIDLVYYKDKVSWVVLDEFAEPDEQQDINEDKLIKTMLALSDAKKDWDEGEAKFWQFDSDNEEQDMDLSDEDVPFNNKNTSASNNKQTYAFSWDSYGGNPWAPIDTSKKKNAVSELVKIASGKAHVGQGQLETQKLVVSAEEGVAVGTVAVAGTTGSVATAETTGTVATAGTTGSVATAEAHSEASTLSESVNLNLASQPTDLEISISESDLTAAKSTTTDATAADNPAENDAASDPANISAENISAQSPEKKKYTAADFPISSDGSCPYCKSTDAVYIVVSNKVHNLKLPIMLRRLLQHNFAYKVPKDDSEPPSFQCLSCTYGFNLDWRMTNLEKIYMDKLEEAENPQEPVLYAEPPYGGHPGPMMPFQGPHVRFPQMGCPPGYIQPGFGRPSMMGWQHGFCPPGYMPGYMPYPMMPGPMPMMPGFMPGFQGQPQMGMYGFQRPRKVFPRYEKFIVKSTVAEKLKMGPAVETIVVKKEESTSSESTVTEESDNKTQTETKLPEVKIKTEIIANNSTESSLLPPGVSGNNTNSSKQDIQGSDSNDVDAPCETLPPAAVVYTPMEPYRETQESNVEQEFSHSTEFEQQHIESSEMTSEAAENYSYMETSVSSTGEIDFAATSQEEHVVSVPDRPVSAVLDESVAAVLNEPVDAVLNEPVAAVLDEPVAAVLDGPVAASLDEPVPSVPDKPIAVVLDEPIAVLTDETSSATRSKRAKVEQSNDLSTEKDPGTIDEDQCEKLDAEEGGIVKPAGPKTSRGRGRGRGRSRPRGVRGRKKKT